MSFETDFAREGALSAHSSSQNRVKSSAWRLCGVVGANR
jgi:hypothetical protein